MCKTRDPIGRGENSEKTDYLGKVNQFVLSWWLSVRVLYFLGVCENHN